MTRHLVAQRSPEWYQLRLGRLCASDAKDMLATIKSGEAAARRDLRLRLVCERLTGRSQEDGYVSADMQRGLDLEDEARRAYEAQTGQIVDTSVGFVSRADIMAGCSPDGGMVGEGGMLEIKCPRPANHVKWLRAGTVPTEHRAQCIAQLWVTGAAWVDFVSYCAELPDVLRLFVVTVSRSDRSDDTVALEAEIAEFDRKARAFLAEVDAEEAALRTLAEGVRARLTASLEKETTA